MRGSKRYYGSEAIDYEGQWIIPTFLVLHSIIMILIVFFEPSVELKNIHDLGDVLFIALALLPETMIFMSFIGVFGAFRFISKRYCVDRYGTPYGDPEYKK